MEKSTDLIATIVSLLGIIAALLSMVFGNKSLLELRKSKREVKKFLISVGHPAWLSKRFASSFLVQVFLKESQNRASRATRNEFGHEKSVEHIFVSELTLGQRVKINLFSPEIVFSDAVVKVLDGEVNTIRFIGKPNENCHPGAQKVVLVINDDKLGNELHSFTFEIKVVDYAFDHVSRPLLSQATTTILGIGSIVMFILTLLGQIDSTLGLASGTTTGLLASVIYARFVWLFQKANVVGIP